jgi:hypothetical protein
VKHWQADQLGGVKSHSNPEDELYIRDHCNTQWPKKNLWLQKGQQLEAATKTAVMTMNTAGIPL